MERVPPGDMAADGLFFHPGYLPECDPGLRMDDLRRSHVATSFNLPPTFRHSLPSRFGLDATMADIICPRGRDIRDDARPYGFVGSLRVDHRSHPNRSNFAYRQVGVDERENVNLRFFAPIHVSYLRISSASDSGSA